MGDREKSLVSVVIPTYNRHHRLEQAIQSVAEQTYDHIELLIVDDCSDPPVKNYLSASHAQTFDRFEILRHDENRGGSAARNTGIQAANGDYVALLDDDDRWRPEKVEYQVEKLREEGIGLVTTEAIIIDEDGDQFRISSGKEIPSKPPELTKQLLCRNSVGSCSAVMVDTNIIDAVGTFDERFPSWQDQEWYIRLSQHCQFDIVSKPLHVYSRDTNERISEDLNTVKNETYPLFLKKFQPVAAKYGLLFERKMRAWAAFRVGKKFVLAGHVQEGRRFLKRAVRLYPFEDDFYKYYLPTLGGPLTYEAARKTRQVFSQL